MSMSGSDLSQTAAKVALLIAEHPKNEILPDKLQKELGIERFQAITIMKELANNGYGEFIVGRRGAKSRFLRSNASAISALNSQLPSQTDPADELMEQTFLLNRPNPLRIRVPADLTAAEVERICKWLNAIAIS